MDREILLKPSLDKMQKPTFQGEVYSLKAEHP